ncbi:MULTISPECIES: hypothetical protein [Trichocoleus]|uniref:DUF1269 domain-containing protein n=1 Tax=Trichocoleus desertorum GB2-A4 TaxID=2933944 RepID=A0ABV0JBE6_9CYAN|nr:MULTISPECIES: hypothetical protein [unclassified Trichocoleus]MBD1864736.1 hypothetical protein [Trichocoleus sp. FACHB-46]MBD2097318.1 hypothetical protein [Trichocoleus sp. FACHB-591]MBD2120367.1 hypothetical protein [Trichocoleus sp. FACHB-262]
MNYLVAVLSDRIQAEAAYSALEKEGLKPNQVAILGKGYQSADEYGLLDPNADARKQAMLMILWLAPFGFAAGYVFNFITGIELFSWAGSLGNHLIGGVLGAISGAMGGAVIGGGGGLLIGGGDTLPYRDRLDAGKYLVVVRGSSALLNRATRTLRNFPTENLQAYTEPGVE